MQLKSKMSDFKTFHWQTITRKIALKTRTVKEVKYCKETTLQRNIRAR